MRKRDIGKNLWATYLDNGWELCGKPDIYALTGYAAVVCHRMNDLALVVTVPWVQQAQTAFGLRKTASPGDPNHPLTAGQESGLLTGVEGSSTGGGNHRYP